MLKQAFIQIVQQYTGNDQLPGKLWAEIEQKYSGKKRHYHTLAHLENLFTQLFACKDVIEDWDIIIFSLCYHDIVYNVLKHDNEEKSAVFAEARLKSIGVPSSKIENCTAQIIATKTHTISADPDTNLFTDADLSILGEPWTAYKTYCTQVRKEYVVYPDMLYKPGRKKVLQHFLQMERIYKTEYFFNKFEREARENLLTEIEELT